MWTEIEKTAQFRHHSKSLSSAAVNRRGFTSCVEGEVSIVPSNTSTDKSEYKSKEKSDYSSYSERFATAGPPV